MGMHVNGVGRCPDDFEKVHFTHDLGDAFIVGLMSDIGSAWPVFAIGSHLMDRQGPGKVLLKTRHFLGDGRRQFGARSQDAMPPVADATNRSEEHTSELQSLMRISYAVFCLKKKTTNQQEKE